MGQVCESAISGCTWHFLFFLFITISHLWNCPRFKYNPKKIPKSQVFIHTTCLEFNLYLPHFTRWDIFEMRLKGYSALLSQEQYLEFLSPMASFHQPLSSFKCHHCHFLLLPLALHLPTTQIFQVVGQLILRVHSKF